MINPEHVAMLRSLKRTAAVFLVLLYLDRPASETEVSEILDIHQETARLHLRSLARAGLITRSHHFQGWILTQGGRQLVLPATNINASAEIPRLPEPNINTSAEIPRMPLKLRESESQLNTESVNCLTDSLNLTATAEKIDLVTRLRAAGVYLKTARAIVEAHDEATIERHLSYYRHALGINLAQGPGWLVLSLKEGWPAPLGYIPEAETGQEETPEEADQVGVEVTTGPTIEPFQSVHTAITPTMTAAQAWQKAKEQIRQEMPKAAYLNYVDSAELHDYSEGLFSIRTESAYQREWLKSRLSTSLMKLLTGICNLSVQIQFVGDRNDGRETA